MNFNQIDDCFFSDGNRLSEQLNIMCGEVEEDTGIYINRTIKNVLTIGDVHGDFRLVTHLMEDLIECVTVLDGIITWNDEKWKDTYIVFVGDLVHSYRKIQNDLSDESRLPLCKFSVDADIDDLKIFAYLKICDTLARQHNSRVILLVGNHELSEILKIKSFPENQTIKAYYDKRDNDWDLLKANENGTFGSKWAQWYVKNTYMCVLINNLILSHAGILPDLIEMKNDRGEFVTTTRIEHKQYTVVKLNSTFRNFVNVSMTDSDQIYVHDFVWSRILFNENPKCECDQYLNYLEKFYSHTIDDFENEREHEIKRCQSGNVLSIQGHNTKNHINIVCNNRVFNIDVGMSKAYEYSMNRIRKDLLEIDREALMKRTDMHKITTYFVNRIHSAIEQYRDCSIYRKPQYSLFTQHERKSLIFEFKQLVKSKFFVSSLNKMSNSFNRFLYELIYDIHTHETIKRIFLDSEVMTSTLQREMREMEGLIINDSLTNLSLRDIRELMGHYDDDEMMRMMRMRVEEESDDESDESDESDDKSDYQSSAMIDRFVNRVMEDDDDDDLMDDD